MTPLPIAFIFLIREKMHPAWYHFFPNPLPSHISIFIHSKVLPSTQDRFYQYYIPDPLPTKWGDISQIYAINRLLRLAYKNTSSQLFFHASESCLPLVGLSRFTKYIHDGYPKGFLMHRLENSRYTVDLKKYLDHRQFRKMRAQGWVFSRQIVSTLLQHQHHTKFFNQTICPTEHVYVNILVHLGINLDQYFINRPLSYFN